MKISTFISWHVYHSFPFASVLTHKNKETCNSHAKFKETTEAWQALTTSIKEISQEWEAQEKNKKSQLPLFQK